MACPAPALAEWMDKAKVLAKQLNLDGKLPADLGEEACVLQAEIGGRQASRRIYHLYLSEAEVRCERLELTGCGFIAFSCFLTAILRPLYFWMRHQAAETRSARSSNAAVVVGMSAS